MNVGDRNGLSLAAFRVRRKLTSSCRRHEMDPQLYFMQLLMNLPSWPASDLDTWLPYRWKQAHAARCAALGIPAPPTQRRTYTSRIAHEISKFLSILVFRKKLNAHGSCHINSVIFWFMFFP